MRAKVIVMSPDAFEQWVREQKQTAAEGGAALGKQTFADLGCGSCHALADAGTTSQVGPDLDTVLAGADPEFIRESIVDPNAQVAEGYQPDVMPKNFGEAIPKEQLDALVEYLVSATGSEGSSGG
jgi:cytochrome c oxidase subunit 2